MRGGLVGAGADGVLKGTLEGLPVTEEPRGGKVEQRVELQQVVLKVEDNKGEGLEAVAAAQERGGQRGLFNGEIICCQEPLFHRLPPPLRGIIITTLMGSQQQGKQGRQP